MKPLLLMGHTKPLTQIKFNVEGDLLFSVAKDFAPCVWFTHNGERLGTFDPIKTDSGILAGHNGAVWCCDVDYTSEMFLTGSADTSFVIWDVRTGQQLVRKEMDSGIRTCGWSYDASKLFVTTDKNMGKECYLHIFDVSELKKSGKDSKPLHSIQITPHHSKVTACVWGPLDESIISGHEDGTINKWDVRKITEPKLLVGAKAHKQNVNDLQFNKDMMFLVSASKDESCSILDTEDLSVLKTFRSDRPLNSASFAPSRDHVVYGGGQEARNVTTTRNKEGKFDAVLMHYVFEEEIGTIKGHFGPINTLSFFPDGKGYASGGEDGFIRVHTFDQDYLDHKFEH